MNTRKLFNGLIILTLLLPTLLAGSPMPARAATESLNTLKTNKATDGSTMHQRLEPAQVLDVPLSDLCAVSGSVVQIPPAAPLPMSLQAPGNPAAQAWEIPLPPKDLETMNDPMAPQAQLPYYVETISWVHAMVNPDTAGAPAYYRVDFQVASGLAGGGVEDYIAVEFPPETTVPANLNDNLASMAVATIEPIDVALLTETAGQSPAKVTYDPWDYAGESGISVTVKVWASQNIFGGNYVKVEFFGPEQTDPAEGPDWEPGPPAFPAITDDAGFTTPDKPGFYELQVWTSDDPFPPVSAYLEITCTGEYTLTVNEVGNGDVVKTPDQVTYTCGTVVTMTANPDPGWTFAGWSGDLVTITNPVTITMYSDKVVTATFIQDEYILTVNTAGSGSVTRDPDQSTYHYGNVVTLTATADPGWTFAGWSGALTGSDNPGTITMDGDKTVTATFTQDEYALDVNIVGNGTATKNPDQATYHYGDVVTLTANADPGWKFKGWSGDLISDANPDTIIIDDNKSVTTTFVEVFTLTFDPNPTGGMVEVEEQQPNGDYEYGETITITAVPSYCYEFVSWTGDLAGYPTPAVVVLITSDLIFGATFQRTTHTMTVYVAPAEGGIVVPARGVHVYSCCTVVTLTASPNTGWVFAGWSGDLAGMNLTETIHIDSDKVVTATFASTGPCFSLTPSTSITTTPLAMHVFMLTLTNDSCGAEETFALTHTDSTWDIGDSLAELSVYDTMLDEGVSKDVVVTMTVPSNATNWMTGTVVVTATASGAPVTSTLRLWTGGEGGMGCRYDINLNGAIDIFDVQSVAGVWPLMADQTGFNPFYDYNLNDQIDASDIQFVAASWPNLCPAFP